METDGAPGKDVDQIRDFTLAKIREPAGLYEFLETMSVLRDTPALWVSLRDFGYPASLDPNVAASAALIAVC